MTPEVVPLVGVLPENHLSWGAVWPKMDLRPKMDEAALCSEIPGGLPVHPVEVRGPRT